MLSIAARLFTAVAHLKMATPFAKIKPSKKFFSNLRLLEYLKNFKLPDKYKGGRIEKLTTYWKGVYADYGDVAKETYTDLVTRPRKAAMLAAGFGFLWYAVRSNPDEHAFNDALLRHNNELMQVSDEVRNSASNEHLKLLFRCQNEGLLRYFSFGAFSIVWMANYDRLCDLYAAQCSFLQPRYLTFYERIVDVGCLGKWRFMNYKMVDFDVNPEEWKEKKEEVPAAS